MVIHNDSRCCKCAECQVNWLDFLQPRPNPFLAGTDVAKETKLNTVRDKYDTKIGIDLAKTEDYNQKYYVTQDGHAITERMTAGDIVAKFGPIQKLEANGFKVVPAQDHGHLPSLLRLR